MKNNISGIKTGRCKRSVQFYTLSIPVGLLILFSLIIFITSSGFISGESQFETIPSTEVGNSTGSLKFEDYFTDQTLRIDYYHTGDSLSEQITLDKMYLQGPWAGNLHSLIDEYNQGKYYIKIYDFKSNRLIYSRGFDSYCSEYVTTEKAVNGIKRTFHESALIPLPKQPINFTLERRDRYNKLSLLFQEKINPFSRWIIDEKLDDQVQKFTFLNNGDPHKKVDIAFLAEGYTVDELNKFKQDVQENIRIFFSMEPYNRYKSSFNVYAVFKPSVQSGTDNPLTGAFKKTALGTTYNALELPRYILTEDNRAIRDIAAHVPYDFTVILINDSGYGGGGIYNFYSIITTGNRSSGYLLLHEFGHLFGGLADEYYDSSVAYNDFYPSGVEPIEANITALLDPKNVKWKDLLTKGIQVPTPWDKEKYERLNRFDRLKFLSKNRYKGKTGAFEGAGYSTKGLYRPMLDCIMFSQGVKPYCSVCENALTRMIEYYTR